ncbi:histone-lysine N-methyltransferase 2C isoform X3 [Engraulis encrasicolus]|uniref:histone-lysine N-methyltransferase 2C isoform X3 n=1 Tax=Engraulis encrasicolus TaxID=184585 RepID=UPI002FD07442
MSSEDKSLEPTEQGQSPSRHSTADAPGGGASPPGSPAPSGPSRPRGRPRKDAASAIHPPRPKRKIRSRGRAQADDENSMDGSERADTEPLDDMEAAELDLDLEEEEPLRPLLFCPGDLDPLSPLFQRSVSEDSAGSSASASENAKTSERLCAFCYCGERSVLGQGELKLFGPTPGYVPLHIRNRHGSSENHDDDYHDDADDDDDNNNDFEDNDHQPASPGQGGSGLKKISSPDSGLHSSSAPGSSDPFGEEPTRRPWDELGQIGLPDDINVQSLFDPTGQCCAHLRCAAWSDGVCRTEGQVLLYVDKAIDSGSTEFCAYCKRLGASIKCCESGCVRSYHFPCAAAAGAFQDSRQYTLHCPDHLEHALTHSKDAVRCLVCERAGELQDQLFCSSCGQHYHGSCLEVPVTPLRRAGWHCPDCKHCLACRNPRDDNKMLVCDMCDKGYHTYCLQPAVDAVPTGGWRCQNCRVCGQCGSRAAGQWSSNGQLCEDCQRQPDPANPCPLCGRSLAAETPKDLLTCHTCKRWVHVECERQGKEADWEPRSHPTGFLCCVCRQAETEAEAEGGLQAPQDRDSHSTAQSPSRHPLSPLPSDPNASDVFMAVEDDDEEEEKVDVEMEQQDIVEEEEVGVREEQVEVEAQTETEELQQEPQEEQKAESQLLVEEKEEENQQQEQEKEETHQEQTQKLDEEQDVEHDSEQPKDEGEDEEEEEEEVVAEVENKEEKEEQVSVEMQRGMNGSATGHEEELVESPLVRPEEQLPAVKEECEPQTEEKEEEMEEEQREEKGREEEAKGEGEMAVLMKEKEAVDEVMEQVTVREEKEEGEEEVEGKNELMEKEQGKETEEEEMVVAEEKEDEVEEAMEEERDVTLEQEASASPMVEELQEEKKSSPSGEPAQEIQVTVTLTEGAESPQHSSASLVVDSDLSQPSQASVDNSPEAVEAMETETEAAKDASAEIVPETEMEEEKEDMVDEQQAGSPSKEEHTPSPEVVEQLSSPVPVERLPSPRMESHPPSPAVESHSPSPGVQARLPSPKMDVSLLSPTAEASPSSPTTEVLPSSPQVEVAPSSPKFEVSPSSPKVQVSPSSPKVEVAPSSPKFEVSPSSPKVEVPPSSPKIEVPPSSPSAEVSPPSPSVEVLPSSPRVEVTPSSPKVEVLPSSPEVEVLPSSPKVEVTPSSPKVEVPSSSPSAEVSPSSPRVEVTPSSPKIEFSSSSPNAEVLPSSTKVEASSSSPNVQVLPSSPSSPSVEVFPSSPTVDTLPSSLTVEVRSPSPVIDEQAASPAVQAHPSSPSSRGIEVPMTPSSPASDSNPPSPITDSCSRSLVIDSRSRSPAIDSRSQSPVIDSRSQSPVTEVLTALPSSESQPSSPKVEELTTSPRPGMLSRPSSTAVEVPITSPLVESHPVSSALDSQPASPVVDSHPPSPAVKEHLSSPAGEEHPSSPAVKTHPPSPAVKERPSSPAVKDQTSSPAVEEHPLSPAMDSHPSSPLVEVHSSSPVVKVHPASPVVEAHPSSPVIDTRTHSPVVDSHTHSPAVLADVHSPAVLADSPRHSPAVEAQAPSPPMEVSIPSPAVDPHSSSPIMEVPTPSSHPSSPMEVPSVEQDTVRDSEDESMEVCLSGPPSVAEKPARENVLEPSVVLEPSIVLERSIDMEPKVVLEPLHILKMDGSERPPKDITITKDNQEEMLVQEVAAKRQEVVVEEEEEEAEEEEEDKAELLSILPDLDSIPSQEHDDMDTTPASDRSFSGFSSPVGGEDKGLKFSPGVSSEGSCRLARSPFSTEASPVHSTSMPTPAPTPMPTQPPPPPPVNTTFFPITPKIGMGKPAISKRKFSPGRPRVKQGGAWSNRSAVAARSPSWSPDYGECGGEGPRTRQFQPYPQPQPQPSPIWTMRVGRGSGFPGRRRPRGANLSGRGGRGRSRLKTDHIAPIIPGVHMVEQPFLVKEEEENSMHNTVVMFSSSDSFTLKQDMCLVCGSFGQGEEGRLLACSQCGQCYHPFCVNIKITKVVLSKGWRCLECTVCEACGQATDPGRLLLCDDCDISYHTYCLDPPLQNVPKGSWKCKWCVSCTQCGATSPGVRCEWQCNYTQCGPCASLAVCPVCVRSYREDDLILQCRLCDRWVHASCQGLNTDEDVEIAADDGFDCTMCRLHLAGPGGVTVMLSDRSETPIVAQIITKVKEPEFQKTYTQDGVCLTESGLNQLQSLSAPAQRRRRPKPKLKLKIINQNSVAVLQTPPDPLSELSRDGDLDDGREGDLLMDCEGKSDSSPEREHAEVDAKGEEGADGCKKRKRKPYRPGIGGFMVRQRSRTGQGKTKRSLSRKDSSGSLNDNPLGKEEGWNEPDTPVDETAPPLETLENKRKKYRRKKTQLEEAFPSYLQEAFFGKDLLDKSKQSRQALEQGLGLGPEHGALLPETKPPSASSTFLDPSSDPLLSATAARAGTNSNNNATSGRSAKTHRTLPAQAGEDSLEELVLGSDDDLLGMLSDNLAKPGQDSGLDFCPFQVDRSASPFAGLDLGGLSEDSSTAAAHPSGPARGPRPLQEEPLDAILSPELDKMVTDGAILSKFYKIPELEGKDVEDLFTAVLSPTTSQPPALPQPPTPNALPGPRGPGMPGDGGMFPRVPMMNGMMGPGPGFPPGAMGPGSGPGGPAAQGNFSSHHRMPFPDNMREKNFNQMGGEMSSQWGPGGPGGGGAAGGGGGGGGGGVPCPMAPPEPEADTMSNAQRSTLKWEKEETLGELATVAPVLYTNVNFPNLKEEFPDWTTRVKQISKLWRKASSQERQPYVQKARDNRAALRMNKVQLSNDSLKRQQQQQQAPDPFDPLEPEVIFKDPLKHKESEHEQEWKFRQGEVNLMRGPLKKQQEKVPKSKAIKSTTNKDVLFGHSNQATIAGSGRNSLQMRQKSKQQAKIEATQKLEKVKSEQQQLQQQQQQQQNFSSGGGDGQSGGSNTPNSGNQSPRTPQPATGGNASPLQPKDGGFTRPQLPGTPTSSSDDVFLRPQPPPPSSSAGKTPTQDGAYSQGTASQPQSPQMFSPGGSSTGSRPSSPWDPYTKMVGTPRPPSSGSSTPRRGSDAQERGRPSPAHEGFGSPTSSVDPYAKPPDTPRPADPFVKPMGPPRMGMMGDQQQQQQQQQQLPPQQQLQVQGRHIMGPGGHPGDPFARPNQRAEMYQRMTHNRMVLSDPYARPLLTPIPGSNESGSVPLFKAPMPPGQQQQQQQQQQHMQPDMFGSMLPQGLRRGPGELFDRQRPSHRPDGFQQGQQPDPYAQQPLTPHPAMGGDGFGNESRMMRQQQGGHFPMTRNPYAHAPGTPRPDYSQQMPDPYAQMPGTPRPSSSDPYAQQPATPRPSMDPYAMQPSTPRPVPVDQFSQPQPISRRQSPSHAMDPYAQMPGTPRPGPGDRYPKSPVAQRVVDPYAQPPGTPRPQNKPDPYDQAPSTPRPVLTDPYSQPPGTPRPASSPDAFTRPGGSRTGPMPHPGDPFLHQGQGRMPDAFARPHGSQTPKHPGISDDSFSLPQTPHPSQTPVHDPFEQSPMTPCPQVPPSPGTVDVQGVMQPQLGDPEDRTKRQLLRQLILRQQQRKGQQEVPPSGLPTGHPSVPPAATGPMVPPSGPPGTPRHWSQEDSASATPQPDIFGRPPPPYPGTMRGPPRFPPGQFVGEQHQQPPQQLQRGQFPLDGQMPRPPFPRDMAAMGMRPQGQRFPFPPGTPGQEQFMRPPHQMGPGGPMVPDNIPPQMRRSMSIDLARPMGVNPQMGNPQMGGLPQHFPPRALPMQQHNIMGQPFIELRHRAPENRMRLPFRPMGPMDQPGQRPPHGFMPSGQEMGFPGPQGPRMMDPMMAQAQQQGGMGAMQMGGNMEAMQQQQQQQQQANMQMASGQQHPPLNRSMSQPAQPSEALNVPQPGLLPAAASQPEELPLPTGEGIEEKLDTDDSAVKDLEDVEVKDLVDDDLETLNLDGEDGLHLDDFLTSGKFDLIAYADPELDLDLEDKKDMFNEELDLADPMEDDHGDASDLHKALSEKRSANTDGATAAASSSSQPIGKADIPQATNQVKKEEEGPAGLHGGKTIKTEGQSCPVSSQEPGGGISGQPSLNNSGLPGDHTSLFGASADPLSGSAPVLSSLLIKEKREDQGLGAVIPPHSSAHGPGLQQHHQNMAMMTGQTLDHGMNPAMGIGNRIDPALAQVAPPMPPNPQMMQMHPTNPRMQVPGFGGPGGPQVDLNMPPMMGGQHPVPVPPHGMVRQAQPGMFPIGGMGQQQQALPQQQIPPPQVSVAPPQQPPVSTSQQQQLQLQQNRPLLLDEQPLLLQDLLDQERQEQQQQRQMQAMIRQRSDTFFPNIDFDAITDPIMKAKMVALQGINKVMAQNPLAMGPMVMNRIQQMPGPPGPDATGAPQQLFGQVSHETRISVLTQHTDDTDGKLTPQLARPNPPNFGPGFVNDAQRKQYEEWLQETQQLLQMQQKFLEEQIGAHRKSKKALSAKQRTAKKAGRLFPEEDAEQLKHVTEQQSVVQKQLEQIRKQQKEHAELIEEYRAKQQQHGIQHPMMSPLQGMPPQGPAGMMPGPGPSPLPGPGPRPMSGPGPRPMNPAMMGPMMGMPPHHPGQPNPGQPPQQPMPPNMPGWHPAAGPRGPMVGPPGPGGPRMPPHMAPQMPPANPAQQVPGQVPPVGPPMVPGAVGPPMVAVAGGVQGKPTPMGPAGMGVAGVPPGGAVGPTGPGGGAPPSNGGAGGAGGAAAPHVNFDDNNPFSEGFQERERRERLREQQERQRVQLMQEVERQRALQKQMEMGGGMVAGVGVNTSPSTTVTSSVPTPNATLSSTANAGPLRDPSLSQMPFFNSELPQDFLQPPRPPHNHQQQQQQQQQMGGIFPQSQAPQQAGMEFTGVPAQGFRQGNQQRPGPGPGAGNGGFSPDMGPMGRGKSPMMSGNGFPPQGQPPRPTGFSGPPLAGSGGGGGHPLTPTDGGSSSFGMDSPSTPLPPNFPGSGQSLIQLYSNIIPEEKGKKKCNRKKKKDANNDDADAESIRTPSTPHSDLTAPLTPLTPSTPTRPDPSSSDPLGLNTPYPGLAPASELERQLSSIGAGGGGMGGGGLGGPSMPSRHFMGAGSEMRLGGQQLEVKLEKLDASECHGGSTTGDHHRMVKQEEACVGLQSPPGGHGLSGDGHSCRGNSNGNSNDTAAASNELLKHLLKNKSTPPPHGTPQHQHQHQHQTPPRLQHQTSVESLRSEDDAPADNKNAALKMGSPGAIKPELLEASVSDQGKRKQQQRYKRGPKAGMEKPPSRYKKRKKEEEERQMVYSNTDSLMSQLKQLSMLPLMEPLIGVNFALFPPYGSGAGQLNGENRLSGSFGSATLDGASDYYSQLVYKQSNLSNPPTPPASLPPTPPPVARQKMVNGFATAEELARKAALMGHKAMGAKPLPTSYHPEEDLLAQTLAHGPKTVDVPASLPTPPHNNQEELRWAPHNAYRLLGPRTSQDQCSDRDSPDSFVPSSSPESVVGMEISRYPDLSRVKLEPPSPCSSPVLPMIPSASGKASEIMKVEVKTEPSGSFFGSSFGLPSSCSKSDLVSIAITLNSAAAENVPGVVAAVANLLRVPVPSTYDETPRVPERSSLALLAGVKVPPTQGGLFSEQHLQRPRAQAPSSGAPASTAQGPLQAPRGSSSTGSAGRQDHGLGNTTGGTGNTGTRPQWCAHCKVVVLGNGVRKVTKDLPCAKLEGQVKSEVSLVFCSHSCSLLYAAALQAKTHDTKPPVTTQPSEAMSPMGSPTTTATPPAATKVLHAYSNNMSTLDVHCLAQLQPKPSPPSSPPIHFPTLSPAASSTPSSSDPPKPDPGTPALKFTVKLKPRPRAVHGGDDGSGNTGHHHRAHHMPAKRWKGHRWRKWSVQILVARSGAPPEPTKAAWQLGGKLPKEGPGATWLRPEPKARDRRRCCLCQQQGDGETDGPARLLNLDLDLWVHLNCALWSSEVYETQAGALINVELALRRGLALRCAHCQLPGATSGCHRLRCTNTYHFTCALQAHCIFFKDKTMLCSVHRPRGSERGERGADRGDRGAGLGAGGGMGVLPGLDQELRCFAVFRRVYVQRDEVRQLASVVRGGRGGERGDSTFRVGSLVFHAVGQLLPGQMPAFHSPAAIFPAGYEASRLYWSMRKAHRRCRYVCSVDERHGRPEFSIRVLEQGYEELVLTDTTAKGVWDQVLGPVAERRKETSMLKLFPIYLKGEDLFGLTASAVTRIVESLPGVEACERYTFRYGRNPLMELPLAINPTGSARSEPKACTHVKRPHTLTLSGSSAKSLQGAPAPLEMGGVPSYSKHVVHSKSAQYRRMKAEWKTNVYLARSRIQGLGLYAARDIEKYTMVIEYIGTIIRNEVANRKEKMYEAQNRGVYMFRFDSEHVIDATITGGPARYINHSCAPNCIAEVVTLERGHKIIISSNRRIQRGEELCYDYKFDLEDDQHKIPCHCGAVNCRKWMN